MVKNNLDPGTEIEEAARHQYPPNSKSVPHQIRGWRGKISDTKCPRFDAEGSFLDISSGLLEKLCLRNAIKTKILSYRG